MTLPRRLSAVILDMDGTRISISAGPACVTGCK